MEVNYEMARRLKVTYDGRKITDLFTGGGCDIYSKK